ncbi:MAG: M1 family aminopeptidase [Longimicrobiales bacterium]|nr:M1 family aminopeptidase [Longimicrobiales bacterium]
MPTRPPSRARLHRRTSASPTALAVAIAFGILVAACAEPPPPPVEAGIPWTLAQHRARTLSEVAYHTALEIPAEREAPIRGRSRVTFTWSDPERRDVVLDFKDPAERVDTVRVNGTAAAWRAEADHVVLPASVLRPGPNEVELAYRAGDDALNRSDDFLYTLFVPDRAHFSLPVFDQPDLKARVSWELTVPEGWVAVANGPPAGVNPLIPDDLAGASVHPELAEPPGAPPAPGPRRYAFRPSRPISTYLMAFAAGRFQVETGARGGFHFTMYHRETDPDVVARNRDAIFDLHHTALTWLQDYTGLNYPFQKFDFVLLPPFQYGGMEHPGSVFYRQSSLMLDEAPTQADLLGRASLIAHETAHMWFGDLVTMRWFDDVWTKEVFANFMAARIVHPSFPDVDHRLRFLLAHHPAAYGVDRTPGANPVRQPLENLQQAGTLYGAIIYQKAPVVMAHLERTVGEETFRDGLREYLDVNRYGNASWPELVDILDARAPADLASWSRVWVEEPGRPTVRLEIAEPGPEPARILLTQEDAWGRGRRWPQTLELVGAFPGGLERANVALEDGTAEVEAWRGRSPRWVLPTGAGIEYGLFLLEEDPLSALMEDLPALEEAVLRGGAWLLLQDALLEEQVAPRRLLELALATLPGERDELLTGQILGLVGRIFWTLLPEEERQAVAPEVERVLLAGVRSAGSDTGRAAYFQAWTRVVGTPAGVDRLRRIWAGEEEVPGVPLSEAREIQLAEALALRGVADGEAILDAQFARIRNPDRKDRFRFVRPALSADAAVREAFFASLAEPANREREPWVLAALGHLQHPLRRAHGATFVPAGLALVEEIQRTGDIFFPGRWLDALLGNHNTPEVWTTVADFLAAHPDYPPRLRGKILQSADDVRRAARIVYGPDETPAWSVGS